MWGWFVSRFLGAPAVVSEANAAIGTPDPSKPAVSAPERTSEHAVMSSARGLPRASELRRLAVLQARGDGAYAYLVETALRICRMSQGAIVLGDGEAFQVRARVGIAADAVAANDALCQLAMRHPDQVTVVGDWTGAPLVGAAGRALGVLWVADRRAGQLSPVQLRTLQLLARQAVLLLEAGAPGKP